MGLSKKKIYFIVFLSIAILCTAGFLWAWFVTRDIRKNVSGALNQSQKVIVKNLILTETSSIGVRHFSVERCKLHHKLLGINTKYGFIPIKVSYKDGKILHIKPEYEICRILALKHNLPIQDIINEGIKNSNFSKESLNQ